MKNSAIKKACALLFVLFGSSSVGAAADQERDEINRRFNLPADARVDVSQISGSVDIVAGDGGTAIVEIERTARSRAELDCNKVVLEQVLGTLIIESRSVGGQDCQNIQVRYRVLLSLPRTVDVSVHGVSGPINIGKIDGTLRISGNSGTINLAQSGRASRISGNSGRTTINLRRIDPAGLELSGNSGAIRLYIANELDVDVKVSRIDGLVSSDLPNVRFTKTGAVEYYARSGSGGPTVIVKDGSGSVSLRHLE